MMGGRSYISNSVRAARKPVTEDLERGQAVEFRSPADFKGWVGGTILNFENNASGLWVVVKCGPHEFEVPHSWVRSVRKNPVLRKSGRGEAEAAVKRGERYLAEGRLDLAKAAVAQARHLARSAYPAKWTQALLGGDVAQLQVLIDQAARRTQAHVNPRWEGGIETCDAPVGEGAFFRARANGKTHYIRAPKGTRIEAVEAVLFRNRFLGMAPYVLSPVRARKNPSWTTIAERAERSKAVYDAAETARRDANRAATLHSSLALQLAQQRYGEAQAALREGKKDNLFETTIEQAEALLRQAKKTNDATVRDMADNARRKNPLSLDQASNARYAGHEVARLVQLREELSAAIAEAQHAIGITKKRAQGRVTQLLAEVRKQEQATAAWRRAARSA
jgi:hypothetical protein